MNDEKWAEIINTITDKFEIIEKKKENLEEGPGEREYVIFNGPLGKMRLERVSRPRVLEKKVTGGKRIGADVNVEYVYSEDEIIKNMKAYKWDNEGNNWIEIEAGSFG